MARGGRPFPKNHDLSPACAYRGKGAPSMDVITLFKRVITNLEKSPQIHALRQKAV
jgi:hypothetical protein